MNNIQMRPCVILTGCERKLKKQGKRKQECCKIGNKKKNKEKDYTITIWIVEYITESIL